MPVQIATVVKGFGSLTKEGGGGGSPMKNHINWCGGLAFIVSRFRTTIVVVHLFSGYER